MHRRFAVFALLVCLAAPSAFAWGRGGHAIVGRLAEAELSSQTRAKAKALINNQFFSDVAADPDEYRNNEGARITGTWHFVTIMLSDPTYDAQRDCPTTDCVIGRIAAMKTVLADTTRKTQERGEALIYLIHFVGDLHQPFHTGTGLTPDGKPDLGGNLVKVKFRGNDTNLHSLWDSGLISTRALSNRDYVERLLDDVLGDRDKNELAAGSVEDWVNAAHKIAIDAHVDTGTTITNDYVNVNLPIADEQLLLAGLRLARLIEEVLGND